MRYEDFARLRGGSRNSATPGGLQKNTPPTRRMARRLGVVAGALAVGITACGPAFALLPPAGEEGRVTATSILLIKVTRVGDPPAGGLGECPVFGTVVKVERGADYRRGQSVVVHAPCAGPGAAQPAFYQPIEELKASRIGRAYLNPDALLAPSVFEVLHKR